MPTYDVKVIVEYNYEVEADNDQEAEEQGWHYEDYGYTADISIGLKRLRFIIPATFCQWQRV